MTDTKTTSTQQSSSERAEGEIGTMPHHTDKSKQHHEETHGLRKDIDENTPLDEVKAPNVFERAKEEFEAIVEAIHPKKQSDHPTGQVKKQESKSENQGKSPRFIDYAKGKIDTLFHHDKSPKLHDKETHGTSEDIDKTTPIDHVKAPNVFERAKEEIEAIVQTIHRKKEEKDVVSSPKKKEGGLGVSIGKGA